MTPSQDDISTTSLIYAEKIGNSLGRRISLSSHEGITGYLSYRAKDPVVEAIALIRSMTILNYLRTLKPILEIREHVSGVSKVMSFDTFGVHSFRELETYDLP
jgi:hypothetical protein